MSERTVLVRVKADVAAARRDLKALGYDVEDSARRVDKASDAMDKVGNTTAAAAAVAVTGLGLVTKAAIDWETAWTGVTKTVDGTPEQMAELEQGLRNLAKTLPSTHDEIAAVAEAAGQLGVKQADILGFTKTMIDLGESTNLSAEDAATAIAQISNVTGLLDREGAAGVRKFGSTLVALGNNGASTERDIVNMASRIAGAGKIVGLTEPELLAVSNALASVGIEAEAGGTAFSNVLIDMSKAVKSGGKDLTGFAEVAGLTADEFARKFQDSPVEAVSLFTQGLGRMNAEGGNVFQTLQELGQSDVRVSTALLKMAGAGDLLDQSLRLGNQAWEENNALTTEAEKRYATAASRIEIARNSARDAAIDFGGALAPTVAEAAEAAGSLANAFSNLSPEMQGTIVKTAVAVTGLLLLVAAGVKTVSAVQSARAAIEALGVSSAKSGKLLGKMALAVAAVATAGALLDGKADAYGVEQLTKDLTGANDAVGVFNKRLQDTAANSGQVNDKLDETSELFQKAFDPGFLDKADGVLSTFTSTVTLGMIDIESKTDYANRRVAELGGTLANLVNSGQADEASRLFNQFAKAAEAQGISVDELKAKMPAYAEALAAAANQQTAAAGSADGLKSSTDEVTTATEAAIQATGDWAKALNDATQPQLDNRAAARQVQEAMDAVTAALKENGKALNKGKTDFDLNTEAGRANQEALDNVASALNAQISTMAEAGASQEELDGKLRTSRDELYKTATRMGLTKEAARQYVEQVLGIPAAKTTVIKADTKDAEAALVRFQTNVNRLRGNDVTITTRYVSSGTSPGGGRNTQGGITRAEGGPVWGAGTSTSDSISAYLSNGEYVVRAAAVQKYGMHFFDSVNAMRLAGGGYAGAVPSAPAAGLSGSSLIGLEISGMLDLGNGLRGMVRGEVRDVAVAASRSRDS